MRLRNILLLGIFSILIVSELAQAQVRQCWIDANGVRHCQVVNPPPPPPPPPPNPWPPQPGRLNPGQQAYNVDRDSALVTVVAVEYQGTYVIRYEDGIYAGQTAGGWSGHSLAVNYGCAALCVGQQAYNVDRSSALVTILGIQDNGNLVIRYEDGIYAGQRAGGWSANSLAVTQGCGSSGLCVGERTYNTDRDSALVQIVGIQPNGNYVIYYLDGIYANQRAGGWGAASLARTNGCGRVFCVGDRAINTARSNVLVTIVGIQQSGAYVIHYEQGIYTGQNAAGWTESSLARTY